MGLDATASAGGGEPTPFRFQLIPGRKPEELLANVRYALTLGLPDVRVEGSPLDEVLSVAGGGPSLADTWREMTGYVAAINGTLRYLLEQGAVPNMCGICHPTEDIADMIDTHPDVAYFVASCVHPKVFDKLLAANCRVYLWHMTEQSIEGLDNILRPHYPDGWVGMTGGTTMGMRWLNLGHYLGFRKFHLHGYDSSYRDGSSHAYPDKQDKEWVYYDGYRTRPPFVGQVVDFLEFVDNAQRLPEPIEIRTFGDGLLQSRYKQWQDKNPPYEWPASDVNGRKHIYRESFTIPEFLQFIPKRGVCIQAGGNVGVYPRKLAQNFDKVVTFEPDQENYRLLRKNTHTYSNIEATCAALGDHVDHVKMVSHQEGNAGAIHVEDGAETFLTTIDSLNIDGCDLIWLDIEGYEELALKGAAKTIEKYKPAVIIEEKSILAELHGLKPEGAVQWLKSRGYFRVMSRGNDNLYVYGGA